MLVEKNRLNATQATRNRRSGTEARDAMERRAYCIGRRRRGRARGRAGFLCSASAPAPMMARDARHAGSSAPRRLAPVPGMVRARDRRPGRAAWDHARRTVRDLPAHPAAGGPRSGLVELRGDPRAAARRAALGALLGLGGARARLGALVRGAPAPVADPGAGLRARALAREN